MKVSKDLKKKNCSISPVWPSKPTKTLSMSTTYAPSAQSAMKPLVLSSLEGQTIQSYHK